MSNPWDKLLTYKDGRYFTVPEQLLEAAANYFQYANDHPREQEVLIKTKEGAVYEIERKPRIFSWRGFAVYLGISQTTLNNYRNNPDFEEAIERIRDIIDNEKYEGAAVGTYNATIIARDLGLAEKTELTGRDGAPLQTVTTYELPDNGRDMP